jgi:MoaA/NifB/PqqE/SkfB family radical SAM enzyme
MEDYEDNHEGGFFQVIRPLKFGFSVLKSNLGFSGLPYKLNLYLTNKCNCRCCICNIWRKKSVGELSNEEISEFFEKNNYFSWIDVTGGEIFLRQDIGKVFKTIVNDCNNLYLLHFPTNGFLTDRVCRSVRWISNNFKGRLVITISVDGPERLHDSLRRSKGCWKRAVKTYEKSEDINRGGVFFGYTISKYNSGRLRETFEELNQRIPLLTLDRIHVNLAQNSGIYYSNLGERLVASNKGAMQDLEFLHSIRRLKMSAFSFVEGRFVEKLRQYVCLGTYPMKRCMALNCTVSVNPGGEVYPCLFFDRRLGSLQEVDFDLNRILSSAESMKLKKDILRFCPKCWSACEAYPSIISNLW